MNKNIIAIFFLVAACNNKPTPETKELVIPVDLTVKENLIKYFDTTTRVWFVEYIKDSSVMVLTDSITKVKIEIPLK